MEKKYKTPDLKKEVDNLQYFSDIDVTQYPSPEQLSIAKELESIENIDALYYYIDGKTVIVKMQEGFYSAFRMNPNPRIHATYALNKYLMLDWDKFEMKQVWKINSKDS